MNFEMSSIFKQALASMLALSLLLCVCCHAADDDDDKKPAPKKEAEKPKAAAAKDEDDKAKKPDEKKKDADDKSSIKLSKEALALAELEIQPAGPGTIDEFVELPGEITLNMDRLAHL